MGQYHTIVSLTAHEYLDALEFNNGLKLAEMSWSSGGIMQGLGHKLQSDWKGHRITLVGDYYQKNDLPKEAFTGMEGQPETDFYSYVHGHFETSKYVPYDNPNTGHHVIVNFSKNEYITPEGYGDSINPNVFTHDGYEGGVMESLLILLAASCKGGARGGGDIESENVLVGSWAGDSIAIIPVEELSKTSVCIDEGMRTLMQDAKETTYAEVDGKILRSAWDYVNNRHGLITV